MKTNETPTISEVEMIFFRAIRDGYASSFVSTTRIAEFPGSKSHHWTHGDYRVIDYWLKAADSLASSGTTTIWFRDQPIWTMSYGGWYDKDAIPFLKQCLEKAYTQKKFCGGRGFSFEHCELLTYVNQIEEGSFRNFSGKERIFYNNNGALAGEHWYKGMQLMQLSP